MGPFPLTITQSLMPLGSLYTSSPDSIGLHMINNDKKLNINMGYQAEAVSQHFNTLESTYIMDRESALQCTLSALPQSKCTEVHLIAFGSSECTAMIEVHSHSKCNEVHSRDPSALKYTPMIQVH